MIETFSIRSTTSTTCQRSVFCFLTLQCSINSSSTTPRTPPSAPSTEERERTSGGVSAIPVIVSRLPIAHYQYSRCIHHGARSVFQQLLRISLYYERRLPSDSESFLLLTRRRSRHFCRGGIRVQYVAL